MVPYAHSLNLSVMAFGQEYPLNTSLGMPPASELTGGTGSPVPVGNLTVSYVGGNGGLEPAPVTPDGPSFQLLASTIKGIWGNDTLVTPTGMYGEFLHRLRLLTRSQHGYQAHVERVREHIPVHPSIPQ